MAGSMESGVKSRIIHVAARYYPNIGGVETLAQELCEQLHAKGFDVTVYSVDLGPKTARQETINGIKIKRYRALLGDPFFLPTPSFFKDLRGENAAILHVHNVHNIFPLLISLSKRKSQQLILQPHYHRFGQTTLRDLFFGLYKKAVPRLLLDSAKAIITNSEYEKESIKTDFKYNKKVVTLLQGISLDELKSVSWNPAYPERILYVGALKKYKKVDVLLRAFKVLTDRKEHFKLVLVGDGPDKTRLTKIAIDLGISRDIEWKSNLSREELLKQYSKARVFVLLSALESFNRAVNEALAIGVPTVVSSSGVFSDFISKGVVETTVSDKPEDLAEAVLRAKSKIHSQICASKLNFNDAENYGNNIIAIYNQISEKSL